MKYVDYIIVGGGISGSILSYVLMQHGASVHVFDVPNENKSSAVAAGLWNPIVLKRFKKVWMADAMIEEVYDLYPNLENWTDSSFFEPLPLRRIFHNPGEQNQWMGLTDNPGLAPYLNDKLEDVPAGIKGHHGSATTKLTGRVKVPEMLAAVRKKLIATHSFTEEKVDWSQVLPHSEGVQYGNIIAHDIISCEGTNFAIERADLGFAPVKGEVIKVRLDRDLGKQCIHQSHFMLGEGNNEAFVGATYAWEGFEEGPTEGKKAELEAHIREVWNGEFSTLQHLAGVRPAVKDRRPMVGPEGTMANKWIFNGMGSRAILMVPYLAKRLAEHLLYGVPLIEECLPQRFNKK